MKKTEKDCSLCISTYNWPGALNLCLQSVLAQSVLPGEVVIGDDGSTDETKLLIQRSAKDFPVPIRHIWQPDEGFKLAQIRNRSFAAAAGNYIIQTDGDIILHRHFIKDHLHFAKEGTFTSGARCMLDKNITENAIAAGNIPATNELLVDSKKKYNAIRFLPVAHLIYLLNRGVQQTKYVLGANMAFYKKDIIAINGYNEDFKGWGKEDNDIALRLYLSGKKIRAIKQAAIIYHLYHNEANKGNMLNNTAIFEAALKNRITFAANGINKYL